MEQPTAPTVEPTTQETPEEQRFREIAASVTAATVAVDEARQARELFRFSNKIPTPENRARFAELEGDVVQKERALQALLAPYAEAKGRVEGW